MIDGSDPRSRALGWAVLGLAMAASAVWLLWSGRDLSFAGDDVYYYARYVAHGFATEPGGGVEYFLVPHNGHLQMGGKLVYRLLFDLFGSNYTAFRVVNLAGLLLCVALFYLLCRRRVGPLVPLPAAVLLLFFGYAWEPLIWAFDMHTVYALAFGLGAVLALEREDRKGDLIACVLLLLSVAMIELGLAFVAGSAVYLLLGKDRWRRSWVVLVPVALYAIWWIWAQRFDQSEVELLNVHLFPLDAAGALAAIMGSFTGLNPTGPEVSVVVTTVTPFGALLAGAAVVALVRRLQLGPVPRTLWLFLVVVLAYWLTIALGDREPDSSRYLLAGGVLVLLVAADALAGSRVSPVAFAAVCVVVLLALPANLAKFYEGRRYQLNDAAATRTEYAMLELARERVDPGYVASADPEVSELGGGTFALLPAAEYFRASGEFGSLAYSLEEVREQPLLFRRVADATLTDALGIGMTRARPPETRSSCFKVRDASPDAPVYFESRAGSLLLRPSTPSPAQVKLGRFSREEGQAPVGQVEPGTWARLDIPPDRAPDRWRVVLDAPAVICRAPAPTGS